MIDYVVMRENFQAMSWEMVGHITAKDEERAVRELVAPTQTPFGTYAAIPSDEFEGFIRGRPLVRITASIETMVPNGEPAHA